MNISPIAQKKIEPLAKYLNLRSHFAGTSTEQIFTPVDLGKTQPIFCISAIYSHYFVITEVHSGFDRK